MGNGAIERHGHAYKGRESPEYITWLNIRARCRNKNNPAYHHYGGRGITVCDRWNQAFENFLADMGAKPFPKASLDRIDNDKGYSPENCRWADKFQQARNRRCNIHYTAFGVTATLPELCEIHGIHYKTAHTRMRMGESVESALGPRRRAKRTD